MIEGLSQLKIKANKMEQLEAMGIHTMEDLVFNFPRRYEVIEQTPLVDNESVTIEATLIERPKTLYGRVQVMNFTVDYQGQELKAVIFNRNFLLAKMARNMTLTLTGKYEARLNKITVSNLYLQPLSEIASITPVYSLVDGMTRRSYQGYVKKALKHIGTQIEEQLPEILLVKNQLIKQKLALELIHFPQTKEDIAQASRYFKYLEFFRFQLAIQYVRYLQSRITGIAKEFDRTKVEQFVGSLHFDLTSDQVAAVEEILDDLARSKQMYRFLQGDVGSGKTVVCAIGLYANYLSGYQGALMAPTEILARQHYQTFAKLFESTQMRIGLLTGSSKDKETLYAQLLDGEIDLVIGTHALFQEKVGYCRLGMVVADEQHRFGVNQRKALKEKGDLVDFMVMSATPIPRTLAMTVYGDMDISTIKTKPVNRKDVVTRLVQGDTMKPILKDLVEYLSTGGQVYVVCPLVSENEKTDTRDAMNIFQGMAKYFKDRYEVGLLHGRLKDDQKNDIMEQFKANKVQILVATTVIEEGVNVANANMMVIYNADRFGLSQLHQLRGRVGRSDIQGICYLLSSSDNPQAKQRLEFMVNCNDGFEIANQDLLYRGPGEILGNRQSGLTRFDYGDIKNDYDILVLARDDAAMMLAGKSNDPRYLKILAEIEMESQNNNLYID